MPLCARRRRWIDWAVAAAVLLALAGLAVKPAESMQAARDGLLLCFNIILPSLFPFFVLALLLVDIGFARALGRALEPVMKPLFNVNGAAGTALAVGFIGGYPVGARTALSLYENKLCGKEEAERLLSFCNNSGPAFIFGVVGAGIFANSAVGLLLYLAHIAASITVGFIFRFYKRKTPPTSVKQIKQRPVSLTAAFTHAVTASFQSVLNICAFVVFFTVAIRMLYIGGILPAVGDALGFLLHPVGVTAGAARQLLTGILELTSGLWTLEGAANRMNTSLSMAAFMLGWAGVSVHAQVLSFLSRSGLKTWTYVTGKLLHGVISAVYAYALASVIPFHKPVSGVLIDQLAGLTRLSFENTLTLTLRVLFIISLVIVGVWLLAQLKRRRRVGYWV